MRPAPLVLAVFTIGGLPLAYSQDATGGKSRNADEASAQQLLQKIHDLRPPQWTYSELASKSDLIVVAKVVSRSETEWDDRIAGDFGKDWARLFTNRLQVLSVLKGQCGGEIDVMTLELRPYNIIVLVNHRFAELRSKLLRPVTVPVEVEGNTVGFAEVTSGDKTYTIEPEYLLYLKRIEGDRFSPVTGQRDAPRIF
jgi:hypothetical protein